MRIQQFICSSLAFFSVGSARADSTTLDITPLLRGNRFCSETASALRKVKDLTSDKVRSMTPREYERMRTQAASAVKDDQDRSVLLFNLPTSITFSSRTDGVRLKNERPKPQVRFSRVMGKVIQTQAVVVPKQVYWSGFETWRDNLFELLLKQEAPVKNQIELPREVRGDLEWMKSPHGREETAVWLSDRFNELPTPAWVPLAIEAKSRKLEAESIHPALQSALIKWNHTFSGDWHEMIGRDDHNAFNDFLTSLNLHLHPIAQKTAAIDPKIKEVVDSLTEAAIQELVITMASSIETFVVPTKRKRDGDWILIHKSVQLFVKLNLDGSVQSVMLKFYTPDVLTHLIGKGNTSQEIVSTAISEAGSASTSGHAKITRQQRLAEHATTWKLSSKVLPEQAIQGLLALGKLYPGQRFFIEQEVLPLMDANADLFQELYVGRFLRKIDSIVENEEGFTREERVEIVTAMIRSKRRGLEISAAIAVANAAGKPLSLENGHILHMFVTGERSISELREGKVYEFSFSRNEQFGTQKVIFHRRALDFIQNDPHDLGSILWLRALERGIVPDIGMAGVKHRNWTHAQPFEWEIKRMKIDWRLLMEKDGDGVWHVMQPHLEH